VLFRSCATAMAMVAIRNGRSRHRLVWHRYATVGAAVTSGLAWATGASIPLAFDVATVSATVGLAVGRLGCHRVGCCFGVTTRTGVRYPWWIDRERHLPLALMESAWSLFLSGLGLCLLAVARPGVTGVLLGSAYMAWRLPAQRLRDPHFRSSCRSRGGVRSGSTPRRLEQVPGGSGGAARRRGAGDR